MPIRLVAPLRSLANACASELGLPPPPRMRLVRRGGTIELHAGDVTSKGHIGAVGLLVEGFVVAAAGRNVLGQATVWHGGAPLWWKRPAAMFALVRACLARGRLHDARDLAYLAIVETLYLEDVEEGTKPAPPREVLALVDGVSSPLEDESGAHLSVLRRLASRLSAAGRAEQVPLLRAMSDVVKDAAYANPLVLNELVAAPALAIARGYHDARGAAALELIEALVGGLVLSSAHAEVLPLLDVLVDAGLSLPTPFFERFVALAALADPRAEQDRAWLEALARAHRENLRPHLAMLAPWAELARAHVRAGQSLLVRSTGADPCRERPKKSIVPVSRDEAARLLALARTHVEHARRLLGTSLVADVTDQSFDGSQRRKHIHEDFYALDGALHRAAGDTRAALAALVLAHEAAQRDAYDHAKKAHVASIRALAKKLGVAAPV